MADRTWRESWVAALSLYDSLGGPDWTHIPRFRQLVAELAGSREVFGLTAVTSHEVLTISPYTKYPDWFDGRRVVVTPLPSGDVRIEHRLAGIGPVEHAETVDVTRALAAILRFISEL